MSKVCPYLIETGRQKITCRGLEKDMTIGLGFSSSLNLREYVQQYCYGDYPRCLLAQAVDSVWGHIEASVCPYNDAVDCQCRDRCDWCNWNPGAVKQRKQFAKKTQAKTLGK